MEYNLLNLFRKRKKYKCIAYVDDEKGNDKMVDAFEIDEYSLKRAYKVAYDVLFLKYPGMGLDVKIYTQK